MIKNRPALLDHAARSRAPQQIRGPFGAIAVCLPAYMRAWVVA